MDRDDDPLLGLGLRQITLADKPVFDACFQSLREPLSDFTFAQVFTWGNSLRIFWKELAGHLCVFANGTGDLTLLMPPIGEGGSDRALAEAFEVMDAYNRPHNAVERGRVEYVSEELLERFDRSRLVVEPMGADYVYDVGRMIDLAGGDLASKRQLKNRFLRNYQHRVEAYDPALHGEPCAQLLRLWKQQQDSQHAEEHATAAIKRQKESLACELTLAHARELGLKGMVVYARPADGSLDWSLRAFTFGEALGTQQSSILIEKTDLGVRGLAQFIFSEFCRTQWAHLPLVNAGDDWGLESLAWTKMSYRPVKLLQKYTLRLAERVMVAAPAGEKDESGRDTGEPPVLRRKTTGETPVPQEAIVRPAARHDLGAALELEKTCFSTYSLSKRQLQYLQQRPSALFFVAEQDRKVVGEGICLVRQHKRVQSGRIYSLAVDGACRGKRIGEKILQRMIADLAARGVKRVYLEVEEANSAAIRLYQRNGFRSVGALPDYYGEGRAGMRMMAEIEAEATVR